MYPLSVSRLQPVTLLAVSPLIVTISSHGSLLCSLLCSFSSHCSLLLSLLHHGQPFLSLQPLQPFFFFSLFAVSSEAFPLAAFLHFDYSLFHCSLSSRLLLTMQSLLKPFLSLQLFNFVAALTAAAPLTATVYSYRRHLLQPLLSLLPFPLIAAASYGLFFFPHCCHSLVLQPLIAASPLSDAFYSHYSR